MRLLLKFQCNRFPQAIIFIITIISSRTAVIYIMTRRKFCFFLQVYGFLPMPYWYFKWSFYFFTIMPYYLTVLYTHTRDFCFTYVICMCDFMTCFVRNDEIKLWNLIKSVKLLRLSWRQDTRRCHLWMPNLRWVRLAWLKYTIPE